MTRTFLVHYLILHSIIYIDKPPHLSNLCQQIINSVTQDNEENAVVYNDTPEDVAEICARILDVGEDDKFLS